MAVNIVSGGEPRRVQSAVGHSDLFAVLGARPFMGRTFTAADTAAGDALVLSYDLWQTQFGSDPSVLGKRIDLDGQPYTVIGVMPPEFHFPSRDVALWTTIKLDTGSVRDRTNNMFDVVARLRPGTSLEKAHAEVDVISARLERAYPKENEKTARDRESIDRRLAAAHATAAARAVRRRAVHAAARLRQPRESALGPRRRPRAGDWPCAPRSARAANESCVSSSPRASCSRRSAE